MSAVPKSTQILRYTGKFPLMKYDCIACGTFFLGNGYFPQMRRVELEVYKGIHNQSRLLSISLNMPVDVLLLYKTSLMSSDVTPPTPFPSTRRCTYKAHEDYPCDSSFLQARVSKAPHGNSRQHLIAIACLYGLYFKNEAWYRNHA